MIRNNILLMVFLLIGSQLAAQKGFSDQLKKVMENYQQLDHYHIKIHTQSHFVGKQQPSSTTSVGEVIKRGGNYYVRNDQKEVYQQNNKRVEIDHATKHVVYYPEITKESSFWESYTPDWNLIASKSKQINITKSAGKTTYKIPVNQFQIESIEYIISDENLIEELVYHYSTKETDEVDQIRVIYTNNTDSKPSLTTFSYAKILHTEKDGTLLLTKQYKDFELINTSSYAFPN